MKQQLKLILLSGAMIFSAQTAQAQTCATQPSCAELGYTLTSTTACVGTVLKCPFDKTKYYCTQKSDVLKNMKLNWNSKTAQSFNTYIYPNRYGCMVGNVMDNGSGAVSYIVNGKEYIASAYNQMANIFLCLSPGDSFKVNRATNTSYDTLYFVPYAGN